MKLQICLSGIILIQILKDSHYFCYLAPSASVLRKKALSKTLTVFPWFLLHNELSVIQEFLSIKRYNTSKLYDL